jgi:nucleotide-binding universal stress UspA family protein
MGDAHRTVKELLDAFAVRCTEADVSFNLLEDIGLPYEQILRESQRYDLVLLGHEGHFRFGSGNAPDETLWKLLKRSPRPVVITPPKLPSGSSVVIAYDGSTQADRALQAFEASGLDLEEKVWVVTVDDNHEAATRQAERAVEFLRLHGMDAVACARDPGESFVRTIVDEIQRRNARLLVMGAYGHSSIREFLLGSITKTVLKQSPVPVLLCH